MKYRSYNAEAKIATGLIMNVFNNVVISRFNNKFQSSKEILVPLVYGTRSRALKELENVNKTIKPPIMAIVKESMSQDTDRLNEVYSYKSNIATGYDPLTKMRGIPINIEYTLSGIAEYEDDIDQMVSNFIPFFKPDIFVSWRHPKYPAQTIKSQIVWSCNVNYQSPTDLSTRDHEFFQFETTFTFKTWFFAGLLDEADDNSPLIETINYTGNEFFDIGNVGYGMHNVFVVPKTMSFSEFKKFINDNEIGKEAYDTVSYPRIVKPSDHEMEMCYPASTSFTASTLKISLLDEDKNNSNYDPNIFGFNESSEIGDSNIWHTKIKVSYSDNGEYEHNYTGTSEWSDDYVDFSIKTSLHSNYDWMRKRLDSMQISSPVNPVGTHTAHWIIEESGETSDQNVMNLFNSSDNEFVADELSYVYWTNLTGRKLNVKRICLTAGGNFAIAPRAFTIEGFKEKRWLDIARITIDSPWTKDETKCFDFEDNDIEYEWLRLTFGRPYSLNGNKIALKNVSCYSVLELSNPPEGFKSKRISKSKYEISFKAKNDDNSMIQFSNEATSTSGEQISSENFGSAITIADNDAHALMRPSIEDLTPVMFHPLHYLIFWYKGRKYGFSVGGNINKERAQTITYGNQFPVDVINGSMHVMTNVPGSPIYQYDEEYNTWFEIGNQTRAGFQRTSITASNGSETIELSKDETEIFSINQYQTECSTQYFHAVIGADVDGIAIIKIDCGNEVDPTIVSYEVGTLKKDFIIPFVVRGIVDELKFTLIGAGSTVNSITIEKFEITGKLNEGDFINNPEFQEISVRNFLATV